jgi:hypothetical protein
MLAAKVVPPVVGRLSLFCGLPPEGGHPERRITSPE